LVFHLYGVGLALAAYIAFEYAERRLTRRGIDAQWFGRFTLWILGAGLVGARLANIATNWSYYNGHFYRWIAVWQGGLASFGGIAMAIPVGIVLERRMWPTTRLLTFCDAIIPALVAGWAIGRFLGPQFMVDGGGHLTHQWFGIAYHGQVGKRVPVPLIQGTEDGLLWLALLGVERRKWSARTGLTTGLALTIWGAVRTYDEHWLLGQQSHSGSLGVQIAGLIMSATGVVLVARSLRTTRT
jgi:phosphatidylglycerol:prolipoprotein diacylglycerol transferase